MWQAPNITRKYDVLCVGRIVLDIFLHPITQKDLKGRFFVADKTSFFIGGTAANTAFVLKKLGATTILAGAVGLDIFGNILIQKLRRHNLYSKNILRQNAATSTSYITIDKTNEPKFIHIEGANQHFTPSQVNPQVLKKSKCIHIGGIFLLPKFDNGNVEALINFAKNQGVIISADVTHNLSNSWVLRNYPYVDVLFVNLEEAYAITQTTSIKSMVTSFCSDFNFKIIVVKMGKKGCMVISKGRYNFYRGFKISPIDQCGAGDAFVGGFLYGLVNGWSEETTAKFANACGAQTCLFIGSTNEVFTKERVTSMSNLKGLG